MKVNQRDREWAAFAIRSRHRFNFTGSALVEYPHGSVDGVRAFKMFDSTGKVTATKHPNVAACLHNVKASVNLHVKMWAEGVSEGTFALHEFRSYLEELRAPEWVYESLVSASAKRKGK